MAMQQSPPGAAPSSAKRACSATATPVKAATESSEEAGGVGRPQGCAARVHVGAQRARMHSPGGGPATGQLHGPAAANADGRAPQPAPANAGQPTRLTYATPAHEIACSLPNTSYQSMSASGSPPHVECAAAQMRPEQMIAHMRAYEYPHTLHASPCAAGHVGAGGACYVHAVRTVQGWACMSERERTRVSRVARRVG